MAPERRTKWLAGCVARLTGDPGTRLSDGYKYRVVITTRDGHKHSVYAQVDTHRRLCLPYAVPQVARDWRMRNDDAFIAFLEHGTHEQLVKHLSAFDKVELMPPTLRLGVEPKPAPSV